MYQKIDRENWKRNAHFEFFMGRAANAFTINKAMDVTPTYLGCKRNSLKFYAMAIHATASAVNRIENYRYTINEHKELLLWDYFHPSYTVLDDIDLPFGIGWTEFEVNRRDFHDHFKEDRTNHRSRGEVLARPNLPDNSFLVTCLPWTDYDSMNFSFFNGQEYLAPLITIGKLKEHGGRWVLPYTLMSNHAVADGYHASKFLEVVQEEFNKEL